ncbi:Protein FAR1-RELATED SEQUENCE 8 [Glycine max]|nr:Protein FAR1-RELATED SEQUENCE 8 [Glycine max]
MDEDQWMHDNIMSEEIDMNEQNEDEDGMKSEHVDCFDAFNTSQVFATCDDVLNWARAVVYEISFETSFVLIGYERSGQYRSRKKDFVRRDTNSRKCECPFKLCGKSMVGGQGWMMKLTCGSHNHEMTKSLVGHPYVGRLTKDEKIIIVDMTKSMVKPRNILLTLKEHNDEDVVHDIFWCHPNAVKLYNACNLVFLIDSTYKTNSYRLSLLDFVGVTPTRMTFSTSFAYLEEECLNNVVWALEWFRGLFLVRDTLPRIIIIDRDLALMNAEQIVFPECTNLLCRFHIDKNVKAKCKSLVGKKNAWDFAVDAWGVWFIVLRGLP